MPDTAVTASTPVVDEAVIDVAAEAGIAAMPGANTPTEMLRAHRAGAPLVKLFPVPAGGSQWVRSLLGPLPFLKVVPTNGVDESMPLMIFGRSVSIRRRVTGLAINTSRRPSALSAIGAI